MDFLVLSDEQVLAMATPIMDNLMDASTRVDHKAHVRDFSRRLKGIVTKDYLQQICANYQQQKGFFKAREPVAVFRRKNTAVIVWRQTFTKVKGSYLAEMLLLEEDGQVVCDHVQVL